MTGDQQTDLEAALTQSDIGVAFALDVQALERLQLESEQLRPGRLHVVRTEAVGVLHAMEMQQAGCPGWPPFLLSEGLRFARLMDRLYVPTPLDPTTFTAILDACASVYETLIDTDRNLRNIARLLGILAERCKKSTDVLQILDFGCGTGLSLRAAALYPNAQRFDLHGFDTSSRMRSIAAKRGLHIIDGGSRSPYDGIIASYVLHANLNQNDIEWIAGSLAKQGVFAANWLHGEGQAMESLLTLFSHLRRGRGQIVWDEQGWAHDPVVVFQVDEA